MDRVDVSTPDLAQVNAGRLSELFPDVVSESADDDGRVVRSVDFDALRDDLSPYLAGGGCSS